MEDIQLKYEFKIVIQTSQIEVGVSQSHELIILLKTKLLCWDRASSDINTIHPTFSQEIFESIKLWNLNQNRLKKTE